MEFNDPEDERYRTVWEDYVAAEFTVKMRAPE